MTRAKTSGRRRARRALGPVLGGMLIAGLLAAGGGTAYAYWSAQASHAGSAPAELSLPAPATMSCTNTGILTSTARVSWSPVTGATGYRVTVTRASGGTPVQVDQPGTSVDLNTGLLGGLLTGLLAPTDLTVRVAPLYAAGDSGAWVSPNTRAYVASARLLPIGTTCKGPA